MSRPLLSTMAAGALLCFTSPTNAQLGPEPHRLGAIVGHVIVPFAAVVRVVELENGQVLVHEGWRGISILDPMLRERRMLFDSLKAKSTIHRDANEIRWGDPIVKGPCCAMWQTSVLLPFRGDSAWWFSATAAELILARPDGRLIRTVQIPPLPSDGFRGVPVGNAGAGLVFRVSSPEPNTPLPKVSPTRDTLIREWHLGRVLRVNLETRTLDTLARYETGELAWYRFFPNGMEGKSPTTVPFPFLDDIVATTDGYVGIFRAREYRFDWFAPNGAQARGSALPYSWRLIDATERTRLVDSANTARRAAYAEQMATRALVALPPLPPQRVGGGGARATYPTRASPPSPPVLIRTDEVPDTLPPTGPGTTLLADADGNVWVKPQPRTADPNYTVWDVISRTAGLIDRVRIPNDRELVGFGRGGFVYLTGLHGQARILEKVRRQ